MFKYVVIGIITVFISLIVEDFSDDAKTSELWANFLLWPIWWIIMTIHCIVKTGEWCRNLITKRVADKKEAEKRKQKAMERMETALKKAGIPYELNEYGDAIIDYWEFEEK